MAPEFWRKFYSLLTLGTAVKELVENSIDAGATIVGKDTITVDRSQLLPQNLFRSGGADLGHCRQGTGGEYGSIDAGATIVGKDTITVDRSQLLPQNLFRSGGADVGHRRQGTGGEQHRCRGYDLG